MSSDDQLIQYIIDRIEKMDGKIDKLLEFKWQIIGGSVCVSILATALVHVVKAYAA